MPWAAARVGALRKEEIHMASAGQDAAANGKVGGRNWCLQKRGNHGDAPTNARTRGEVRRL